MICLTTSCVLFVYCIWVCYSGIIYQNCVLQWGWQFVRIFWQIVRIFCHDLTDRSCLGIANINHRNLLHITNTCSSHNKGVYFFFHFILTWTDLFSLFKLINVIRSMFPVVIVNNKEGTVNFYFFVIFFIYYFHVNFLAFLFINNYLSNATLCIKVVPRRHGLNCFSTLKYE